MTSSNQPGSLDPTGPPAPAQAWEQRYREGRDGWELGRPAPPLAAFLGGHPLAPGADEGLVLVPGCGRGHEVALLAALGFRAVGLDFSATALAEARRLHGDAGHAIRWLEADLFDAEALAAAGCRPGSLAGVLEHTCFCAIGPDQRPAYLTAMASLLRPGGWLLGLFWCHGRPGGPPWGSDPVQLEHQIRATGLAPVLWEPAQGSAAGREGEWLGLWRRSG